VGVYGDILKRRSAFAFLRRARVKTFLSSAILIERLMLLNAVAGVERSREMLEYIMENNEWNMPACRDNNGVTETVRDGAAEAVILFDQVSSNGKL
jgi:hypothetical protein